MPHPDYPEDVERRNGYVVSLLLEALAGSELEPRLIPPGRIESLRGGLRCFDLGSGGGVDAAVLLLKLKLGASDTTDSNTLYRVDYAVRGNIRGILPGRIISRTALWRRGLIKKRIVGLRWETPLHGGVEASRRDLLVQDEGLPPGPGELWEGGPHQKLTDALNQDAELLESLRSSAGRTRRTFLPLSIFSDRWGESIRIGGSLWLGPHVLLATYITPTYLGIVDQIGRHIKGVRREFGGIAF